MSQYEYRVNFVENYQGSKVLVGHNIGNTVMVILYIYFISVHKDRCQKALHVPGAAKKSGKVEA